MTKFLTHSTSRIILKLPTHKAEVISLVLNQLKDLILNDLILSHYRSLKIILTFAMNISAHDLELKIAALQKRERTN